MAGLDALPKEVIALILKTCSMQDELQFYKTSKANDDSISKNNPHIKLLQRVVESAKLVLAKKVRPCTYQDGRFLAAEFYL